MSSPSRRAGGWLRHLLPAALLLAALAGVAAHDFFQKAPAEPGPEPEEPLTLLDDQPRIAVRFHNAGDQIVPEPSMRFGLVMLRERDPKDPRHNKKLTFDELGRSNNTCLRIDNGERLFGQNDRRYFSEPPGHWEVLSERLDRNPATRPWPREGARSVWSFDDVHIAVTQTVEVVPGEQSRLLDTCLVRYRIENRDSEPHRVGVRFMLDTYIGANDGVPFLLPGTQTLCDTQHSFDTASEVPDFIQALERPNLEKPGTIAQVQFRLGGTVEAPDRVTLGAWPNSEIGFRYYPRLRSRLLQQLTGWDVPVLSLKTMPEPDSAVVIYWNERSLAPGAAREVGFAYGLGGLSGGEAAGKLALTVGGAFVPGGEFTVTAYVQNPRSGQKVTLELPEGFEVIGGDAEQAVPPLPPGAASPNSPVTWKVRAPRRTGKYALKVRSSTGESQSQPVIIRGTRLLD